MKSRKKLKYLYNKCLLDGLLAFGASKNKWDLPRPERSLLKLYQLLRADSPPTLSVRLHRHLDPSNRKVNRIIDLLNKTQAV